ncbi:MAG TPA: hypothetical protein VFO94_10920 [Gammaproteobacteria bacterium]|nr:hypothetical protein [Gammaproteobacteria bacterium]
MRVEAANAAGFEESVAAFEKELSTARHYVFMLALQDIWAQGLQRATAEQREYTEAEYFRQLDGLTYDEIVTLADPTGQITKERYRAGVAKTLANRGPLVATGVSPSASNNAAPVGGPGGQYRGGRGY